MLTKSILTATALVLAAGLGSASAGERFATIADLSPQALSADEMAEVRGTGELIVVNGSPDGFKSISMSHGVLFKICHSDTCVVNRSRPHDPCF